MTNSSADRAGSTVNRWFYPAAAFFLCNASGAFSVIDRMKYGEWAGKTGGDPLTQVLGLLQIVLAVFLFWAGTRNSRKIGAGGVLLLVLVGFLMLSALWSVDSQASLRRGIGYLFFVLASIGIANGLSGDEYMDLVRKIVFYVTVVGLVIVVISPANALMVDGTLRGAFTHKNVYGQVLAAGVLASLHGFRLGDRRRWSCAAMIVLFVGVGFAVRSGTALMTMFALIGGSMFATQFRRGGASRAIALAVCVPVLCVLILAPDAVLGVLGKDATLTGRTELWEYVDKCIAQRPFLGWGFAAFWSPINPVANQISTDLGWSVPQAHHGLREMLLELGFVGTSIFGIIAFRNIRTAIRCLTTASRELGLSLLLCCMGIFLVGLTEEVLVDPGQVAVGLFFVLGLVSERALRARAYPQRLQVVTPPLRSAVARAPGL